jgi:Sec7-like guanine-nucleotide exchange factor
MKSMKFYSDCETKRGKMKLEHIWDMYQTDLKMKVRPELNCLDFHKARINLENQEFVDIEALDEFMNVREADLKKLKKSELVDLILKMSEAISDEVSPLNETAIDQIHGYLDDMEAFDFGEAEKALLWCNNRLKRQILPSEMPDMSFL